MNYQIEDNGQVLYERDPGEWVHYDMQYHIRAEIMESTVYAYLFDYLGESAPLEGVPISFRVNEQETIVESLSGVATLSVSQQVAHIVITAPSIRGTEIGEPVNPPSEIEIIGEQLVQRELEALELKAENQMLGEQLVAMELRLLALEGGAGA